MTTPYGEVYVLTCTTNGKQYVGQTTHGAAKRWEQHCDTAKRGGGYFIGKAIRKYGSGNFTLKVLGTADTQEDLDSREVHWIQELNVLAPNGYNLQEGGNGGRPCEETRQRQSVAQKSRQPPSLETREKMRQSMLGTTHSLESREKSRQAKLGTRHTDEAKQRMSLAKKGKPMPLECRAAARIANLGRVKSSEELETLRRANTGRKMSPEAVEKSRQANLGRKRSPEAVEATRQAHLGKKLSPEHIEKVRQANLGRKMSNESRAKMRESALKRGGGTPASLEAMRQANLGRVLSPEDRAKLSDRLKGIKRSPEACERMRAAKANISEETRERMRQAARLRVSKRQAQKAG